MARILIIDDDIASCRMLQLHFRGQGHDVDLAHSVDDGLNSARSVPPDLIILDIRMPGRDGLDGLPEFKDSLPDVPVIMITAFHDMESTIRAMKNGADDYIHKPIDIDELDHAVLQTVMRRQMGDSEMSLAQEPAGQQDQNTMVGHSRAMKEVFKTIGLVAPQQLTVLVTGDSGTGKELVARAIHDAGSKPSGPFVAVNCAALVETLLESELFGHEKGAFTGAVTRQSGKFALASGGTILLDEIGELPPTIQAKLLRVLQEKEYVPVGGKEILHSDARVIATTNADLLEQVQQGGFREDLYYRLKVVTIHLPPLRDRIEDLHDLVPVLLARINRDLRRKVTGLSRDVMESFLTYDWPGNVRELENVLMKAVALCTGNNITRELIPESIYNNDGSSATNERPPLDMTLNDVDQAHIARVLTATNWHRGRACRILGISRPRLRRLMKQYELVPPDYVEHHRPDTIIGDND